MNCEKGMLWGWGMQAGWIKAEAANAIIGYSKDYDKPIPLNFFIGEIEAKRKISSRMDKYWNMGETLPIESLGELGDALGNSPTLGKALRILTRGFALMQSETQIQTVIDGDEVHISYRVLDPRIWPRRADAELSLGLIRGICGRYGVGRNAVRAICFEHEQDGDIRNLVHSLGCNPLFGHDKNRLTLSSRVLGFKLSDQPSQEAERNALLAMDSALTELRRSTPVAERVSKAILSQIGRDDIGQVAIASRLGMSERSLRRALAAENMAFNEILERCRRMHGIRLLIHSSRPLSEVALALGYADQTAFSRAFSRWFGRSPRDIRRHGLPEASESAKESIKV